MRLADVLASTFVNSTLLINIIINNNYLFNRNYLKTIIYNFIRNFNVHIFFTNYFKSNGQNAVTIFPQISIFSFYRVQLNCINLTETSSVSHFPRPILLKNVYIGM